MTGVRHCLIHGLPVDSDFNCSRCRKQRLPDSTLPVPTEDGLWWTRLQASKRLARQFPNAPQADIAAALDQSSRGRHIHGWVDYARISHAAEKLSTLGYGIDSKRRKGPQ